MRLHNVGRLIRGAILLAPISLLLTDSVSRAADITGTNGNDLLFYQGVEEQVTGTVTNAYSGESVFINDIYNANTATYDGLGGTDTLLMTNVSDYLAARDSLGNQTLFSVEKIIAGNGGDIINLSDSTIVLGNMNINGGGGDDILWGNAGNDLLQGVDGNDRIHGGPGNDIVNGGNGKDIVDGGSGNDTVTGDAGNDTLVYRKAENVGATDNYDGGTGDDALVLKMTSAEAAASAGDIATAQAFILANFNDIGSSGPQFTFNSFGLTFSNVESLEVDIVPEPSEWATLGLVAPALLAMRRRRSGFAN